VGGVGAEHFVVMEMHYDNPYQQTGKSSKPNYIFCELVTMYKHKS